MKESNGDNNQFQLSKNHISEALIRLQLSLMFHLFILMRRSLLNLEGHFAFSTSLTSCSDTASLRDYTNGLFCISSS
jgi:hypothetical protein